MPEPTTDFTDLFLTPHGLLLVEPAPGASPWGDAQAAGRVAEAFGKGCGVGLLDLGTRELGVILPPAASFFRELTRQYLTRLCQVSDLDQVRELPVIAPPPEPEAGRFLESAPPFRGGEYLNLETLAALWRALDAHVREEVRSDPEGASAWLRGKHPLWRMVGRVTLHLAENKKHPTHPFAFLATYASRISSQSRLQHLPLGRALQEYAGAANKQALLNLLSPLQKAAESAPAIKQLVESGRIYRPLAWSPREAFAFLKDVPLCEQAGLIIRLPDWWKAGRPPRPRVNVKIGQGRPAGVGAEALLDFSVETSIDGEPLTPEEWESLMQAADGLVLVRGRWVEADPEKLKQALEHWKNVERMVRRDGLSFADGMRLMAGLTEDGARAESTEVAETEHAWTGVEPGEWLSETLRELREPSASVAEPIPNLQAQLRPYQVAGVHWLWFLSRLGLGGCLADDMGLGKTIQVLALLLKRKAAGLSRTSLLVVPASLLGNWRSEIERFAPALTYRVAHPSEPDFDTLAKIESLAGLDLVITTYGMLSRSEPLRATQWDLLLLDEAQAIKNPGTRQTRTVKELRSAGRFALTGTPVENRAGDLWSIFDFLNPGLLGSASSLTKFVKAQERSERPNFGPLRALTKPYILRRLKTDKRVIADLPEKTEMRAWCTLTKPQAALYQKAVQELAEGLNEAEGIKRKGLVLAFIMRFKQICNHPSQWTNDSDYSPEASGKFQRLRELVEQLAERQEKALVFTQFRELTDPLAGFLAQSFGRPGLVLHGGTAVGERRRLVDAFQRDDGPPFFVLTVKAGGTGLNLTQAAQVIHFDRWWNPAVENQATDRAFRIGQKQNVLVHKFVCRGTVEERIDKVIEDKKTLSTELLEGGGEKLLTEMNNDELLRFVALDLRRATEN